MSIRILTEASAAAMSRSTAVPRPDAGGAAAPPRDREVDGPSPFARMLRGLGDEAARGESATRAAAVAGAAGRDASPVELLALQSSVYRYSEVIDLSSKLVDRASSGVKTVISGQ